MDIERALGLRAAEARALAERVRAVSEAVASVDDVRWRSPAARRFRRLALERAAALRSVGALLDDLADHLDALAVIAGRSLRHGTGPP